MTMDVRQIHTLIVRPVLNSLGMGGLDAEALVLGTAAVEERQKSIGELIGNLQEAMARLTSQIEIMRAASRQVER